MAELENKAERTTPMVENRASKPLGILPKNTQAIVIAVISVIMVGAIAFSGSSAPKAATKSPVPSGPTIVDPNQARIAEYRQRLDEQARKLAAEQAQFQQARQQFAATTGVPPGAAAPSQTGPYSAEYAGSDQNRGQEDSIENDRKKRAYLSLFASNVALSYRKENAPTAQPQNPTANSGTVVSPLPAQIVTPQGYFFPTLTTSPSRGSTLSANQSASASNGTDNGQSNPERRNTGEPEESTKRTDAPDKFADINKSEGKPYRVFEGTVIETVLTNRLNGSFAGPVNCLVTTNLYSHDGQQLLIPQGSRVLGEVKRVTTFGQERLAVVFHRLIMPDGFSVSLDQFKGLNQIGETGLRDQINHHYVQIFGVSLAIGAIAGLAQADTRGGIIQSSTDAYRQGVADSLSQSSLRILDRYLNVLPTLTIREGHRVKLFLSDDLMLPAYKNHRMPGDL
jgi:type IV secretory pathway VirB10-like protein